MSRHPDPAVAAIQALPRPRRLRPMAAGDEVRAGIRSASGSAGEIGFALADLARLLRDAVSSTEPPALVIMERAAKALAQDAADLAQALEDMETGSSPLADPEAWKRATAAAIAGAGASR